MLKSMKPWIPSLLAIAALLPGQELPRYDIKRASGPIVVDGKMDDAAWRRANKAENFHFNWYQSGAKEKTEARLLWDDTNLYVGFRCQDRHISAKVLERHGPVSLDDCVEVFLRPDPDKRSYYGFEMNVIGTMLNFVRADWYKGGRYWEPEGVQLRTSHHGLPGKEESSDDNGWVLEVAIPFTNFKNDARNTPPRPGDVWRINLNRSGGKTDAQYSTWSPVKTPKPNFHQPDSFGYMTFVR